MKHIAADIGGTNTRLALVDADGLRRSSIRKYQNASHAGFGEILKDFMDQSGSPRIGKAVLGVAGPVRGNAARLTNLDWTIDCQNVSGMTGATQVAILNDLEIIALAAADDPHLKTRKFIEARNTDRGNGRIAVIGMGTGVNIAMAVRSETGNITFSSEYGHSSLPHSAAELIRQNAPAYRLNPDISVETALSGRGLATLYRAMGPSGLQKKIDPADIIAAALSGKSREAEQALQLFNRIAGAVAANIVCQFISTGGIYVAGSVGVSALDGRYANAFLQGYVSPVMQQLVDASPVSLITDEYAPLLGCAVAVASIAAN